MGLSFRGLTHYFIVSIDDLELRVGADLIALDLGSVIKMQKASKSWELPKNCLLD